MLFLIIACDLFECLRKIQILSEGLYYYQFRERLCCEFAMGRLMCSLPLAMAAYSLSPLPPLLCAVSAAEFYTAIDTSNVCVFMPHMWLRLVLLCTLGNSAIASQSFLLEFVSVCVYVL